MGLLLFFWVIHFTTYLQESVLKLILFLLYPLLLTIVVECSIVLLIYRKPKYSYYVFLLNVLTNPALNLIMLFYFAYKGHNGYYLLLYVLEVVVVVTEGLLFAKLTDKKLYEALLVLLLINVSSYLLGVWML